MVKNNLTKERIGISGKNNFGSIMKIVEYTTCKNIYVKFEDGTIIQSTYGHFIKGEVSNPYDKTVYGIGFIGEGEYKTSMNSKHTPQYNFWFNMLRRCYDEKMQEKSPTYKGVTVCEEWFCFNTFAKWFDDNYYEVNGEQMNLDKDILFKGNKVYSPETCVFVPKAINMLFVKSDLKRGGLPIGVCFDKRRKKYRGTFGTRKGKRIEKLHDTQEDAFQFYKLHKENYIKQVADEYKDKIPTKLYDAMVNYIVEITD